MIPTQLLAVSKQFLSLADNLYNINSPDLIEDSICLYVMEKEGFLVPPKPKETVKALMVYEGRETKQVANAFTENEQSKPYLVCWCPRSGCRAGVATFLKSFRFYNPFYHLKARHEKELSSSEQQKNLTKPIAKDQYKQSIIIGTPSVPN